MIKESPVILVAENIPEELKELNQWVSWRYEGRDDKLTKVPYTPQGRRASSTDPTTWSAFSEALGASQDHDGIGFVFSEDDPYAGIDLDECRDPYTGNVERRAAETLKRVGPDAYTEISPSGFGIHIIVRASVRGGGMRRGNIEMYSRGRFFTITGRVL